MASLAAAWRPDLVLFPSCHPLFSPDWLQTGLLPFCHCNKGTANLVALNKTNLFSYISEDQTSKMAPYALSPSTGWRENLFPCLSSPLWSLWPLPSFIFKGSHGQLSFPEDTISLVLTFLLSIPTYKDLGDDTGPTKIISPLQDP